MTQEEKIRKLEDAAKDAAELSAELRTVFQGTSFQCFRWSELMKEAAEDEKQRTPVRAELEGGGSTWWNVCGDCHTAISTGDRFCRQCGRPLIWEVP